MQDAISLQPICIHFVQDLLTPKALEAP